MEYNSQPSRFLCHLNWEVNSDLEKRSEGSSLYETFRTAQLPDTEKNLTFNHRIRQLSISARSWIFYLQLALLAMTVFRGLAELVTLLFSVYSASAALQIVPGSAWTDVRFYPLTSTNPRV